MKIFGWEAFSDLKKAFDSFHHDTLISKLDFNGVEGKTLLWFKSYFRKRYQRVTLTSNVNGQIYYWTWKRITQGVLQGSILGLLLFLIYINDLPKTVNVIAEPVLFEDDTTIFITSSNKSDLDLKATTAFNLVNEWLNTNFLRINLSKTHFMQFTRSNKPKSYLPTTNLNKLIQSVSNTKSLGIYINDTINWKNHIDHILTKLSVACRAMRIIKPFMSLETLRMVYHYTFHSVIS